MTQSILAAVESGLHAYIVEGSEAETIAFARDYAKAALCSRERRPCLRCSSCLQFQSGRGEGENHPDYFEIHPTKKTSRASIKKESIEAVIDEAALTSHAGHGKVFVFSDFHTATVEGQNALLKLLEEPPKGTRFLLLVRRGEDLLPTIRSRAGVIHLGEGERRAEELRHRTFNLIDKVMTRPEEAFLARDFFDEEKDHLDWILGYMESYLRDVAVAYETGEMDRIENRDYQGPIARRLEDMGMGVYDAYDAVMRARFYLDHNVNRNFVLEWMLFQFGGLEFDR